MGRFVLESFIWRYVDISFRGGFRMAFAGLGFRVWWLQYSRSDVFVIPFASDVVYNFFIGFDWKILPAKVNDIVPLNFGMDKIFHTMNICLESCKARVGHSCSL